MYKDRLCQETVFLFAKYTYRGAVAKIAYGLLYMK